MRSRDAEAEEQWRQTIVLVPSNPAPAGNLEASECKSSWKAKKLEVVAPAAAERSGQSR